jgi:hypothetical protein
MERAGARGEGGRREGEGMRRQIVALRVAATVFGLMCVVLKQLDSDDGWGTDRLAQVSLTNSKQRDQPEQF